MYIGLNLSDNNGKIINVYTNKIVTSINDYGHYTVERLTDDFVYLYDIYNGKQHGMLFDKIGNYVLKVNGAFANNIPVIYKTPDNNRIIILDYNYDTRISRFEKRKVNSIHVYSTDEHKIIKTINDAKLLVETNQLIKIRYIKDNKYEVEDIKLA